MSNLVVREFSEDQVSLIKKSIAPTATAQEFELFLYRCKHMGLDPLKPGQIHFVKYGTAPGTIIVGREGFRSRAGRTGKHAGTKLGLIRDESGKCIGAWCEVYRTDWTHPAREEVSLSEYNTGKAQWAKMPETMIKKVAEAAALRMAFPDDLGGLYINEEMDQAAPREVIEAPVETSLKSVAEFPEEHIIGGGKREGQRLGDVIDEIGLPAAQKYIHNLEALCRDEGRPLYNWAVYLKVALARFGQKKVAEKVPDFVDSETEFDAGDFDSPPVGPLKTGRK